MAQALDSEANHDSLLPWPQIPDICTSVKPGSSGILPAICAHLHTASCPEIERVAEANEKRVHGDHVMDCIMEESGDFEDKEVKEDKKDKRTRRCLCTYGKSVASDYLNLCSSSSRQCHCSPIAGGEMKTVCAWGESRDRPQFQNSGSSVSKRKQCAAGSHRPGSEDKHHVFEFRHSTNPGDHMAFYRTHHTVADVGRTARHPPRFGVDVPDPYAVRIKNICSIATSCDLTALAAADLEASCADFNSVISADSGAKDKSNKIPAKDKSRRKEGNKTRSPQAQTRSSKQQGEATYTIPPQSRRDVSDYMREYNEIRRERGLHKIRTLPNIQPGSDSSVATQRLLYELRSPFTRLLHQKRRSSGLDSPADDFPRKHSTCFKLSEFLARALSGGECVKSPKATKSSLKLIDKSNTADVRKAPGVRLPELVGQTLSATTSCTRVVSVAMGDVNLPRSSSVPATAPSEQLPVEYRVSKRPMHDLMSIT